jgi:flagellar protein FliO/FliZ
VKLWRRLALFGTFTLLFANGLCAQEKTGPDASQIAAPPAAPAPSPTPAQLLVPSTQLPADPANIGHGSGLQLSIYLCLLIALLAGGTFLLKNGFTIFQPKSKGARKLNIAETRMLGNRQFLVVAEYEDRKMLIGVCPGRIELLCDLSGKSDEPFSSHLRETTP